MTTPQNENSNWSIKDSTKLYRLAQWGEGFFKINDDGHLCVLPHRTNKGPSINISDIIAEVKQSQIKLPIVIRFHDILRSRVIELNETFAQTIKEANYNAQYFGVYPIKVNQMREVVEEVLDAGSKYNYGLEAGSKAELMAVMALNTNKNALTILNGYKDREYLKLALMCRKMGRKIIVVIEKFSELPMLLQLSEEMNIDPIIGVRAKLNTKGSGKWANSTGENAKFGLTIPEIVKTINYLKERKQLHLLKLFHFHIGSQIPDIRTIKDSLTEAARIYCQIVKLGARLDYFDVGGGLGVNYEGTKSQHNEHTINYTLKDYVSDVVYIIKQTCDLEDVIHPNIVSESGRAVAAHHSCLITNVFGTIKNHDGAMATEDVNRNDHILIQNMNDLFKDLNSDNVLNIYNDASALKEECLSAFKLGVISLNERAKAEILFQNICDKIVSLEKDKTEKSLDLLPLIERNQVQYLCNFSVFQSAPDSWAIGQVLPVMPISRLKEKPTELGILADITCDSDGKIDKFLGKDGISTNSLFHNVEAGEEYLVGIFLTGAYQDIMGDMHNLYGRLYEFHVYCDDLDPNDYYIEEFVKGNSAEQILGTLQYSTSDLAKKVKQEIDFSVREGKIRPREGVDLCDFYERCLADYTYLTY